MKFTQFMREGGWTPEGGYKHLLERIADGLDVRCDTKVVQIERAPRKEGAIQIVTRPAGNPSGAPTEHHFDKLVLTGPLEHASDYLRLTPDESFLFSRIRSHDYYVVLATLDIQTPHPRGLYIVPRHTSDPARAGHVTAFARMNPESTVYHFWGYRVSGQTMDDVLQCVRDDVQLLGGRIAETHVVRQWSYAPRVSSHDLSLGYFRRFEAMQGQADTYYAGSLLSFELTDTNIVFARNLVRRCFAPAPEGAIASGSLPEKAAESPAIDPLWRVPEQVTLSILEIVAERYQRTPNALAWTFLDAKGKEVRRVSYRTLVERAYACALRLKDVGVRPGDRVALVYEPDTDEFIIGFLGCLFAEAIAVPTAAPDPRNLDVDLPRFVHVLRDCDCQVALTTRFYSAAALAGRAWQRLSGGSRTVEWPKLTWIRTDGLSPLAPSARMPIPRPAGATLAYLQYTSGSTSNPKGVMISHANVLENADLIRRQTQVTASSVLLGWVPLFHDMGLVGGPINALYTGAHLVFFSPMSFLKNPKLWLEALSKYRATHTESPNFGYEFLLRRIAGESLEGIDLSHLTHALFGGEAMRPRTFERVAERLHGTGFRAEAMTNIYGAAEATLFLSGGGIGSPPLLTVDTKALETQRRAVPASPHPSSTTTLIGSRIPDDSSDFRIVDPETRRLVPEGSVGEIWLSSPSVTRGYWGRSEEENAKTFRARIADDPNPVRTYLRTGDLGFVSAGVLYICGRHKEMMILEGRNLYPMDIEAVAMNAHPALRQGCVAALSVDVGEQEKLVVVAEVKRGPAPGAAPAAAIAVALAEQFHLTCEAVILVKADALPKTSSGKIQRLRVREAYLRGEIDALYSHTPEPQESAGPAPDEQALLLQEIERGTFAGDAAATERWFRCLVASALQISPEAVDTTMDLSRYGIDSARAVTMGAQLSKYVGEEIPPSVLFEHRSIDALVGYLCGVQRPGTSVLFQLQEGVAGGYPNLFCVHPAGGSALAYLSFVDKLPREVPVYAFGNESGEAPADDLEAMAERYVTELLAVQPAGPHSLLGYSFGGAVAYEMARQLRRQGHPHVTLFMVDTPAPLYSEDASGPRPVALETISPFLETALLNRLISDQLDDAGRERLRRNLDLNHTALVKHRIDPNDQEAPAIIMFRAADEAPRLRDFLRHAAFDRPDFGWAEASPQSEIQVRTVPGDHFTVMNEPAALVELLVEAIQSAPREAA